jgi:outer membrane protein TolC
MAAFQAEADGARARLAALMGRPGALLTDSLDAPPVAAPPADAAAVIVLVSEAHPRLRELRAEQARYELAARAARRMLWPDLQMNVSYGFRRSVAGMAQDNMWSATLGFMLPVFAGSRELPEAAGMDAMARSAAGNLKAATLELESQARSLHAAARADARTVTLLADTVLVTERRAVAASRSAYDAGASDLWRVFEAMHELYSEEVMLVRARQDLAHNEAKLLAVTAHAELFNLTLPNPKGSER